MFSFRHPVPASKFAPDQRLPEWIWPGLLATGCLTLLTGEWFSGKTMPPEPVANWKEGIAVAKSVLLAAGEPLSTVDIWKGWREDCPQPALKTSCRWLAMAHADRLLDRTGSGHRNDGFKYWAKG